MHVVRCTGVVFVPAGAGRTLLIKAREQQYVYTRPTFVDQKLENETRTYSPNFPPVFGGNSPSVHG